MKPIKVYIAHPLSDPDPDVIKANVQAAALIAAWVNIAGQGKLFAICPHTMCADIWQSMNALGSELGKAADDPFWYKGTIAMMLDCDAILMSGKWWLSQGCCAENREWVKCAEKNKGDVSWFQLPYPTTFEDVEKAVKDLL